MNKYIVSSSFYEIAEDEATCSTNYPNLNAEEAYKNGVKLYGRIEDMDASISYLKLAHDLDPENGEYINYLAKAYYLIQTFDVAKYYLEKCISTKLENFEKSLCAAKLAGIYITEGNVSKVHLLFNIAYELDNTNLRYLKYSADFYFSKREYDIAIADLKKCLLHNYETNKYKEDLSSCASLLGDIYSKSDYINNDLNKAAIYYNMALNFYRDDGINSYKLSFFLIHNGQYLQAVPHLKSCVDADSRDEFTDVHKANCANYLANYHFISSYSDANKLDGVKYSEIAYELQPNKSVFIYNLAYAYYKDHCTRA